jgi:hypothetical protein
MASGPGNIDALRASATEYFKSIFGEDAFRAMKEAVEAEAAERRASKGEPSDGKKKKSPAFVRKLLESKKAKTQCEKVLTGEDEFELGKTPCWICGEVIDDPRNYACEHVLPVLQASFFWTLYEGEKSLKDPRIKLEYGWAHANPCNTTKSDMVFIKREEEGNAASPAIVDESGLKKFLKSVANYYSYDNAWVETRMESIITERLQPMLDEINKTPALSYLASVVKYIHPSSYSEKVGKVLFSDVPVSKSDYIDTTAVSQPMGFGAIRDIAKGTLRYVTRLPAHINVPLGGEQVTTPELLQEKIAPTYLNKNYVYSNYYSPYKLLYSVDDKYAFPISGLYYLLSVLYNLVVEMEERSRLLHSQYRIAYTELKKDFLDVWASHRDISVIGDIVNSVESDTYRIEISDVEEEDETGERSTLGQLVTMSIREHYALDGLLHNFGNQIHTRLVEEFKDEEEDEDEDEEERSRRKTPRNKTNGRRKTRR